MSDNEEKDAIGELIAPLDSDKPAKSLKQLVTERVITKKQLRSLLFLMQTGGFSSCPEDAAYVAEELVKLRGETTP